MRPGRVTFRKATPGTGGTPAGSRVRGNKPSCPRAGALAAGLALALACLACLSSCERGAESAPDQPQGFPGAAGQGGYGGPVTLPDAAALAGAGGGLFTREAWEFSELTPEEKAESKRSQSGVKAEPGPGPASFGEIPPRFLEFQGSLRLELPRPRIVSGIGFVDVDLSLHQGPILPLAPEVGGELLPQGILV